MLIAMILNRPLADAKALADDPAAFTQEMTRILLEKQSHPLIAQMIKPAGSSDPPSSNSAAMVNVGHPRLPPATSLPLCNTSAATMGPMPWLASASLTQDTPSPSN